MVRGAKTQEMEHVSMQEQWMNRASLLTFPMVTQTTVLVWTDHHSIIPCYELDSHMGQWKNCLTNTIGIEDVDSVYGLKP